MTPVLWFLLWTVLVLATLVGAFFLLRHLYRIARALLAEVERSGDVLAEVSARGAELLRSAEEAVALAPVELSDPGPARARRVRSALATARRRGARADRHEQAYRRWRALSR